MLKMKRRAARRCMEGGKEVSGKNRIACFQKGCAYSTRLKVAL
jgi:hypothetical protein